MAIGLLEKAGIAVVGPDPAGGRERMIRLTPRGRSARDAYCRRLAEVERRWQETFGAGAVAELRLALSPLVGAGAERESPLFRGLEPYPDGWRATVPPPTTLPHFPMVLHRAGYPDGS